MRFSKSIAIIEVLLLFTSLGASFPALRQHPFNDGFYEGPTPSNHNVSTELFAELEEFARLVDIAYCVGVTGIQVPFECVSRCDEFPGYQLVDTWNTGPLMSDSCGYIALDHHGKRVIVAFRGTYSITNTIVDLATIPQEYVPYPGDPDEDPESDEGELLAQRGLQSKSWQWLKNAWRNVLPWFSNYNSIASRSQEREVIRTYGNRKDRSEGPKCSNCTVHMGFFASWKDCRRLIIPHLRKIHEFHPSYKLNLVGHSLGGAVAALAALETEVLGWHPTVTTFGEPRIGNTGLRDYLDVMFELNDNSNKDSMRDRYRRITHANDPVPLLPLTEWGYKMHSGEIYISKLELQPSVHDIQLCSGDEDADCIFGAEADAPFVGDPVGQPEGDEDIEERTANEHEMDIEALWGVPIPARYRIWQLFFAHRDYFWRLGLCIKGGDPINWGRKYRNVTDGDLRVPK